MDITLNQFSVEVPEKDTALFKYLVSKLGWLAKEVIPNEVAKDEATNRHYHIDALLSTRFL